MAENQKPPVRTWNNHAVHMWIKEQQHAGLLKRCVNLHVYESPRMREGKRFIYNVPGCTKKSFEWPDLPWALDADRLNRFLEDSLHQNPIRCPHNCVHYQSLRVAQWKKAISNFIPSRKTLAIPFDYFIKLDPTTRVLIFILLIVVLAPRLKDPIIQIYKSLTGK
ncbi:MAG: hypothetical protein ACJ71W_21705 [Terriglobales bacterium]